jgi:hypothetical protein
MNPPPQQRGNKSAQARGIQFEPINSSYSLHLSHTNSEHQLYFPTVLHTGTFLPQLQKGKQQSQISFGNHSGNQFQFANFQSLPPEPQLCSSASWLISVKPSIFPANQTRGRHFCFLTADWPTIWRTPTVQTSNMSQQVVTNQAADIAASPVPTQAGAPVKFLATVATNAITTSPTGQNAIMADAMNSTSEEFLLFPDNVALLDAFVPDYDFNNLLQDINMVLEYEILELPAPVPSVHNDILSDFPSCESAELPGALAIALERAESAHHANLDRLTAIRGTRVQINLNL